MIVVLELEPNGRMRLTKTQSWVTTMIRFSVIEFFRTAYLSSWIELLQLNSVEYLKSDGF